MTFKNVNLTINKCIDSKQITTEIQAAYLPVIVMHLVLYLNL